MPGCDNRVSQDGGPLPVRGSSGAFFLRHRITATLCLSLCPPRGLYTNLGTVLVILDGPYYCLLNGQ